MAISGTIAICLTVANLLTICALFSTSWRLEWPGEAREGLFEVCTCMNKYKREDYGLASQLLLVGGTGFIFLSFLAFVVYLCCSRSKCANMLIGLLSLLGVIFLCIGYTLYVLKYNKGMEGILWAFWTSVAGAGVALVASLTAFGNICRERNTSGYNRP